MKSVPVHVSKRYSTQPISQKVRHKISKGGYVILRARAHRHFSSRCFRTWLSPLVIDTPPAKWAGDGVLEIPSISQSWFLGMAFQQNTFSAFVYLRLTWVNMFSVLSFSPPHYPAPPIKCRTKIIAVYKSPKKKKKKKKKKNHAFSPHAVCSTAGLHACQGRILSELQLICIENRLLQLCLCEAIQNIIIDTACSWSA